MHGSGGIGRLFLLAFVRLPGPVNDVGMNRIGVLHRHLGMREGELRRIGKTGHAFIPMAAAQDDLIPILVNFGRHIAEIGNRAIEHPRAAPVESGRVAAIAYESSIKLFALANDFLIYFLLWGLRYRRRFTE